MHRFLATCALAMLAACSSGSKTGAPSSPGACLPTLDPVTYQPSHCTSTDQCCSRTCVNTWCDPANTGGPCSTTLDCLDGLHCKSGICTAGLSCRVDGDACVWDSQCCGSHCGGSFCGPNHAPVANAEPDATISYRQPYTLQNLSTDPDGDTLTSTWSLAQQPAASALVFSSTATDPTFTPDAEGRYILRLVVLDGTGPLALSAEDAVTLDAVNFPPEASTGGDRTVSRNVAAEIPATASDPDGDALRCAWEVTPPGAAAPQVLVPEGPCSLAQQRPSFTPPVEGAYLLTFTVRDVVNGVVVHTIQRSATITAVNDAPVAGVSYNPFHANLGPPGGTTPPVVLDASSSADRNGDALSYAWAMTSTPGGVAVPLTGSTTANPSFVPPAEGEYLLTLVVSDPPAFGRGGASSAPLPVVVRVGRHVLALPHEATAVAYAKGVDKVVIVGRDPGGYVPTQKLWVLDPIAGTETAGIELVAPPVALAVSPDGRTAVVSFDANFSPRVQEVNLQTGAAATPEALREYDAGMAWSSRSRVYYFQPYYPQNAFGDAIHLLDLTIRDDYFAGCTGCDIYGARGTRGRTDVSGNTLHVLNANEREVDAYAVGADGTLTRKATAMGDDSVDLWTSPDAGWLVLSSGSFYRYLAPSGTLTRSTATIPGAPLLHADAHASGAAVALSGDATALLLLDLSSSGMPSTGQDSLPIYGVNGYGAQTHGQYAFLSADGTRRFVITLCAYGWGLVSYP